MGDASYTPVSVSQQSYYPTINNANMSQYSQEQYFAMLQQQQQLQAMQHQNGNNSGSGSIQPHQLQSSSASSQPSQLNSAAVTGGTTSASGSSGNPNGTTTTTATASRQANGSNVKARRDSMDSGNEKDGPSKDSAHQKFSRSKGVRSRFPDYPRQPSGFCWSLYSKEPQTDLT